jgi:hypothetical protein
LPGAGPDTGEDLPLLGRDRQLAVIDRVLESGGPAVIAVVARPGLGRTVFLDEVEDRAVAAGWRVARRDPDGEIGVGAGSTPISFAAAIRRVLDLPIAPGAERPYQGAGHAPGAASGTSSGGDDGGAIPGADPLAVGLVRDLHAGGPTIVLLDDCDPRPPFVEWFSSLLAEIRRASPGVAVVVVGLPGMDGALSERVDTVLELGPLPEMDVRALLERLGRNIAPPLAEEELTTYVEESTGRPAVLGRLARLLALVSEPDVAGSEAGR